MKFFAFPAFLLFIAFSTWKKVSPLPAAPKSPLVDTLAEHSLSAHSEVVPARIILEDSVVSWIEELADLRPVRPYRPGEEIPFTITEDLISTFADKKPTPVSWQLLSNIQYVLTYNNKIEMEIYAPIFPDTLKHLAGKIVSIRGYIIPFDDSEETVALSANPYSSCFFCGKASPASVLTLRFAKKGKRYKLDDRRTFKGRLHLNYDDPDEFYYVLEEARED